MATHTVNPDSFATRLGKSLGRGVGSMLRGEQAVWSSIARAGLPGVIVTPVKWVARSAVIGGGALLAAWGLLYVLAVVAMVAIVIGLITNSATDRVVRKAVVSEDELPYGTEADVFGRTKGWFESESKYQ